MGALTPRNVNYSKLMKSTSIGQRVAMTESTGGRQLLAALTPTEVASLFPEYYKKSNPTVGQFVKAVTTTTAQSTGQVSTEKKSGTSGIPQKQTTSPESKSSNISKMPDDKSSLRIGVYTAFRNAGYSHQGALVMAGEVNRENGFKASLIFGTHKDPYNNATNVGMFSWQGSRAPEVMAFLKEAGALDENGNIKQDQQSLDAMAKFTYTELEKKDYGGGKLNELLKSDDIDKDAAADIIGKKYIKWRIDDPRYRDAGIRNRNEGFAATARDVEAAKSDINPKGAPNSPSARLDQSQEAAGYRDRVSESQADATHRKLSIKPELKDALNFAAHDTSKQYGEVMVDVTSGGQTKHGPRTGSHRHDIDTPGTPGAGDVNLYRVDDKGRKTLLDPRNAEDQKIIGHFTKRFSSAIPGAGVGAQYMTDPTKMHFGGPETPEGAPIAYKGADWFRQAHQQGVAERDQAMREGYDPLKKYLAEREAARKFKEKDQPTATPAPQSDIQPKKLVPNSPATNQAIHTLDKDALYKIAESKAPAGFGFMARSYIDGKLNEAGITDPKNVTADQRKKLDDALSKAAKDQGEKYSSDAFIKPKEQDKPKTDTATEAAKAPPVRDVTKVPEAPAQEEAPVEAAGGTIRAKNKSITAYPIEASLKTGHENKALVDTSSGEMLGAVSSTERLSRTPVGDIKVTPESRSDLKAPEERSVEKNVDKPQVNVQKVQHQDPMNDKFLEEMIHPAVGYTSTSSFSRHTRRNVDFADDNHFNHGASNFNT